LFDVDEDTTEEVHQSQAFKYAARWVYYGVINGVGGGVRECNEMPDMRLILGSGEDEEREGEREGNGREGLQNEKLWREEDWKVDL